MLIADCVGCQNGDHEHHDGSVRGAPGGGCSHTPAVGGHVCMCKGDCAERFARRQAQLASWFNAIDTGLEEETYRQLAEAVER